MKFKCFTVYDDKAKAYLPPFFLPEIAQAVRTFGDCATDPKHEFGKHPEDYTLFQLGDFDSSSGVMEVNGALLYVVSGIEVRNIARKIAEQIALETQRQSAPRG